MSNYNPEYFYSRVACPVCNSTRVSLLYECPFTEPPVRSCVESHYRAQGQIDWLSLEGTDYTVSDCQDCGLIFQKHAPNDRMLDQIYNVMIDSTFLRDLETTRLTVNNFEDISGELSTLFRALGRHPSKVRFLDFGLGHGRWARIAAAIGAKVYATEISPDKIAFARTIGVEIIDADALSNMKFDVVHTEQVFEHLTEPRDVFMKLADALAPGGLMKIAVPPPGRIRRLLSNRGMIGISPQENQWNPSARAGVVAKDYVAILPLEHLNAFSDASICKLAAAGGMEIASRTRRQSVPLATSDAALMLRSVVKFAKASLRPLLRRSSGYYLLRKTGGAIQAAA